jgi:hypothetical protein
MFVAAENIVLCVLVAFTHVKLLSKMDMLQCKVGVLLYLSVQH